MKKPLNIAFVIVGAFAVVLLILYWRAPRSDVRNAGTGGGTEISQVAALAQAPKGLSELVDFSKVKPYNIQKRTLENGSIQEVLNYDTGHLRENYEILKKGMVEENKFSLKTDTFDSTRFALSFERGSDRVEVVGVPKIPPSATENSTIIISLYLVGGEGSVGNAAINDTPPSIQKYFNLSKVRPYNIHNEEVEGGVKSFALSFKTTHMSENYEITKKSLLPSGFVLSYDIADAQSFEIAAVKEEANFQENISVSGGGNVITVNLTVAPTQ